MELVVLAFANSMNPFRQQSLLHCNLWRKLPGQHRFLRDCHLMGCNVTMEKSRRQVPVVVMIWYPHGGRRQWLYSICLTDRHTAFSCAKMTGAQNCAKLLRTVLKLFFRKVRRNSSEWKHRPMLFHTYLGNYMQRNAHTGLEGERGQNSARGTSWICFTMACPDT